MARKKKQDFPWSMVITAIVTFGVGIVFMLWIGTDFFPSPTPDKPDKPKRVAAVKPAAKPQALPRLKLPDPVSLYFSGEDGRKLAPMERKFKWKKDTKLERGIGAVVEALIKGPGSTDKFFALMPDGTRLLGVKVKGRTAYVDLSGEFIENHPGGSSWEVQSVYSIVYSITRNFDEITGVQLLFDGKLKETVRGHVATDEPIS